MKKINIDEFCNIKSISNPTFSTNGKNRAFVVSQANKEKNTYESYIYAFKGNELIKLTNGGKESNFFFLDDDTLCFVGDREDKKDAPSFDTKFYTISLNGGEASHFLTIPLKITDIHFLKNKDIIFTALVDLKCPDLFKAKKEEIDQYIKNKKENEDYEELEEVPFWFNGLGFTKGMVQNLFYLHFDTKEIERINPYKLDIMGMYIDKDESKIIFAGCDKHPYHNAFKSDLYEYDFNTKALEKLIDASELSISKFIYEKEGLYLFASKSETGINTDPDIYKYNFENKQTELVKKFGKSIYSTVGSDIRYGEGNTIKYNDGNIYFISTSYDSAVLMKYNIAKNKFSTIISKDGSIDSFDCYKNKLLICALYDMKALELYDEKLNKLTSFNDYLDDYYVSKPERLFFNSKSDLIHGFILKPIDFDENKKYPVILDIHGGPKTVYGEVFYHEMQYWTSKGYFVIYCNPTGSDGRGRKFADIRGKYGTIDFEDIMNFVDCALDKYPQMDKNNLFETGGSYGGFMTNWIIGHTDRFKACASQRSISNWTSFSVSDIGPEFAKDQCGTDMWTNLKKTWFHSPIAYINNVKTPTLFIHSNEDYRCPIDQGIQMYTCLIQRGIESKLVYFKGENHELSRSGKPLHRIKRLNEITEWFEKHLN